MKLTEMTFDEFVSEFWPCQSGGESYDGSALYWSRDEGHWEIERVQHESLAGLVPGHLLGQRDPYELYTALSGLTDDASDEDVKAAIRSAAALGVQCCYVDDPKNSNYWSDFDGTYYDDGAESDGYVWHRENGVLTLQEPLDEWAVELVEWTAELAEDGWAEKLDEEDDETEDTEEAEVEA